MEVSQVKNINLVHQRRLDREQQKSAQKSPSSKK